MTMNFKGFDRYWYEGRRDDGQLPCTETDPKKAASLAYEAGRRAASTEAAQDRAELRVLRAFHRAVEAATNDCNYTQ